MLGSHTYSALRRLRRPLACCFAALAFPCAAQAAVVEVNAYPEGHATHLVVTAPPGEANRLSLERRGEGVVAVRDEGAPLDAGYGCGGGGGQEVTCSILPPPGTLGVNISTGDGDDRLSLEGLRPYASSYVSAGQGDDVVIGGASDDHLFGEAGNDRLSGGGAADRLSGAEGADVLRGDAGEDTAAYDEHGEAVTVTLDDRADDGAAGEGDDVGSDVENVIGGRGPDRLRGSDGPNRLEGGHGDDDLAGGAGDDTLTDSGSGGRFAGGPGRDTLWPGRNSVVDVRDGEVDTVRCRFLLARPLQADAADVLRSCVPPARARGATARVTASGRVELRFVCEAVDQACLLRVEIRRARRTLARASLRLDAGRHTASLRLNARGRRLVRRYPRLSVVRRVQLYRTSPAPSSTRRYRAPFTLRRRP